jgi:signal transduction histidine kinase
MFKRFSAFIGPYDINVSLLYSCFLMLNIFQLRPYTYQVPYGPERIRFFCLSALLIILLSLPLLILLKASRKFWRGRVKTLGQYCLEVSVIIFLESLIFLFASDYLLPILKSVDFLQVKNFWFIYIVRTIFIFLFISFTQNRERTLASELRLSSELNEMLSQRYKSLVDSDEELRDQVSTLLHDRVQSELTVSALKLRQLSDNAPASIGEGILPIVANLERLRSIDLRQVAQLLTPNISAEGIAGSLESLCEYFNSEVDFSIQIPDELEGLNDQTSLGIYRIVEQAIINTIKHGPATSCEISLIEYSTGLLKLEVSDDGPGGLPNSAGKGTVIIDAWVSILGGSKKVSTSPGAGYSLQVFIPISN